MTGSSSQRQLTARMASVYAPSVEKWKLVKMSWAIAGEWAIIRPSGTMAAAASSSVS